MRDPNCVACTLLPYGACDYHANGEEPEEQEKRDLMHRWNVAASNAGYCGTEFHNEPERVFSEVRKLRSKHHQTMLENVRLRRRED